MVDFARRDFENILSRTHSREKKKYFLTISMGSMVVVDWLCRYPGDLSGAVLINTSLRGFSPFYRRLSPTAWSLLARIAFEQNLFRKERLILELTSSRSWPETFASERARIHKKNPIRLENAIRQLIAAARFFSPKQLPSVPMLLLNSLGDRLVHPQCSQAISDKWGWQIKTHPTAGHDLPLDDPDWTLAQVQDWVTSLIPSA